MMSRLNEVRSLFAKMMAMASQSDDPRIEGIFEHVHREDFLGKGPWKIWFDGKYINTPSADPIHVNNNMLVALDDSQSINNGEPFLHARWIGKITPKKGEIVTHIGTGTGYYTAILSMLVRPEGRVYGIELNPALAAIAQQNLVPFDCAQVIMGDAVTATIRPSDIIYVNAGVVAPPLQWLKALKPGGRMIFPWRPTANIGIAMLITHELTGFAAQPTMASWFIPCVGASLALETHQTLDYKLAWQIKSLYFTLDRRPDETAVAMYEDFWFSTAVLP